MNEETKALITILIREVQDLTFKYSDKYKSKSEFIKELLILLNGWIKANDLHPERCNHKNGLCFIDKKKI